MNAVTDMCQSLARNGLMRLVEEAQGSSRGLSRASSDALRQKLVGFFALDLCGLLNWSQRDDLERMAEAAELSKSGSIGELRARLWEYGAEREADGRDRLGSSLQPVPIVLRGKLVQQGRQRGSHPPADLLPRPIPSSVAAPAAIDEPETLEELLGRADRLIGVRLGSETRDKGRFGARIEELLAVRQRGVSEPDWRGEVEVKSVPVVVDSSGFWRVVEDPAVSMASLSPLAKLRRVLWVARVADAEDSPILSWFYQEMDAELGQLLTRYLHQRPKGGAGARTKGWYLHKNFFVDSGFLLSLNG